MLRSNKSESPVIFWNAPRKALCSRSRRFRSRCILCAVSVAVVSLQKKITERKRIAAAASEASMLHVFTLKGDGSEPWHDYAGAASRVLVVVLDLC